MKIIASALLALSVLAGIAAPATVPSGRAGFHASWYGQSGYSTLCPGQTATAVVAYYNSGTRGWLALRRGVHEFMAACGRNVAVPRCRVEPAAQRRHFAGERRAADAVQEQLL